MPMFEIKALGMEVCYYLINFLHLDASVLVCAC